MRLRSIILSLLACVALLAASQPTQRETEWEWYLDEVINDVFVGRNYFEYYYTPSASDMRQQREKGEVTYFLNSPEGLNLSKVRTMIDRLMSSYDDIEAVGNWNVTSTICWKEFRYEKNKFRFNVKRKALEDGTFYVSVVETADFYKSLGKGKKKQTEVVEEEEAEVVETTKVDKPARRKSRDRKPITQDDVDAAAGTDNVSELAEDIAEDVAPAPVVSEKEKRRAERERQEALKQEERLAKRRAREERRAEEKARKEAEKQLKAEEKQRKEEEKRLKREEARQQREQERQAAAKQAAASKQVDSKYNHDDVALWLSEKYDFTQTSANESSCTMFSTAVKDVEMAKLAIKNALKGSNARMAVPWRLNSETQAVETGYTVDGHVLVFAVGKNEDGNITLTVTEVSGEEFEQFKQGMNN